MRLRAAKSLIEEDHAFRLELLYELLNEPEPLLLARTGNIIFCRTWDSADVAFRDCGKLIGSPLRYLEPEVAGCSA